MNSVFNTYKGTIEVIISRIQQDVLQANGDGTTNISQEDLEKLFVLMNSHGTSGTMDGWEATKKAIESEVATPKKTTKSRKK